MTKTDLTFIKTSSNPNKVDGGLRLQNVNKENTAENPLISVVTVVYNGEKFIEYAIESILNQTYKNIEYIIVDGNSSDSTLDIIKKYDSKIDYWVSEKDSGIYDAMNKGVSLCTGQYIGILNADDYYALDTCEKIKNAILSYTNVDIFHGNVEHVTFDGETISLAIPKSVDMLKSGMVLRHPSCFVSKKWYKKHGGYDRELKIASDFKFLYHSYKNGAKFKNLGIRTTFMREGGVSDVLAKQGWKEVMQVCKEVGDSSLQISYYSLIRQIKYFINKKVLRRI